MRLAEMFTAPHDHFSLLPTHFLLSLLPLPSFEPVLDTLPSHSARAASCFTLQAPAVACAPLPPRRCGGRLPLQTACASPCPCSRSRSSPHRRLGRLWRQRSCPASAARRRAPPTAIMAMMEHIVVVGDPGTGKSTLLTSLCEGAATFRSGVSIGSGLTYELQTEVFCGKRYSDTPGLNDPIKKQAAADAIANAIILGGAIKLLFVITLEAGRVRASNLATIQIVLDALVARGVTVAHRFSVIINKMSPKELEGCLAIGDKASDRLFFEINQAHPVDLLLFLESEGTLEDANDGQLSAEAVGKVRQLLARAKSMVVQPGTRVDLETDRMAALTAKFLKQIAEMQAQHREDLAAQYGRLKASFEKDKKHLSAVEFGKMRAELARLKENMRTPTWAGVSAQVLDLTSRLPIINLFTGKQEAKT